MRTISLRCRGDKLEVFPAEERKKRFHAMIDTIRASLNFNKFVFRHRNFGEVLIISLNTGLLKFPLTFSAIYNLTVLHVHILHAEDYSCYISTLDTL